MKNERGERLIPYSLKISEVRKKLSQDVIAGVQECEPLDSPTRLWKNFKDTVIEAANKHIPKENGKVNPITGWIRKLNISCKKTTSKE